MISKRRNVDPIWKRCFVAEGSPTKIVGMQMNRWKSEGARSEEYGGCGSLPSKFIDDLFCHSCGMWPSIVMEQKNIHSQSCFLDCLFEASKLLTLNFSSYYEISGKQLIMQDAFLVPPNAEDFAWMMFSLHKGRRSFI